MPPQYRGGNKRPRNPRTDRQTRSTGLGTYRKLLKATGNEFAVRPSAGFLSQVMGIDDKGNVGFPIDNALKKPKDRKNLGMVDEVLSLPTLVELLGFDPPQFSEDAAERLVVLKQAIRDDMGIDEPEGFLENAGEALGTMGAQLPVPGKKKVDIVLNTGEGFLDATKRVAKKILGSAPEFFTPTIDPKVSNYLTGAGFGGLLGSMADEPTEEEEQYVEEDDLPGYKFGGAIKKLEELKRMAEERAKADEAARRQTTFIPSGQQTTTFPPELLERRRQRPNATLEQLLRYGAGPEFNNFFVDPTFGTPVPGAAPVLRPFVDPPVPAGEVASTGFEMPRQILRGSRSSNVSNALQQLRRSLGRGGGAISVPGTMQDKQGFATGGMAGQPEMSDDQAEQMATALTNLVAKYRNPNGAMK